MGCESGSAAVAGRFRLAEIRRRRALSIKVADENFEVWKICEEEKVATLGIFGREGYCCLTPPFDIHILILGKS